MSYKIIMLHCLLNSPPGRPRTASKHNTPGKAAGSPATPLRARTERNLSMNTSPTRPPEKLPDPWLFDSESLLGELDRCRELVLEIPITNPNATQLYREGQRAFATQTLEAEHKHQRKPAAHAASKIVGIRA